MKVLIFAGRIHHWLKLKPIYNALQENGHQVAFICANNSINIDPSTEFLADSGDNWIHVYEYLSQPELNTVIKYFNRIPQIVESIAPFWAVGSAQELAEVYAAITGLMLAEQPDAILILHENNYWTKLLAWLCNKYAVPCYAFQEGLLREVDQENLHKQSSACEYSNKIFVWGESAKEQYLSAGIPEEKIIISGPVHLDYWHQLRNNPKTQLQHKRDFRQNYGLHETRPLVLFMFPMLNLYKGNLREDVLSLHAYCRENGLSFMASFHPMDTVPTIDEIAIFDETDPLPAITAADVVLLQHSTVGVESLALGVPIIEFNQSRYPILQSWHDDGVAERISGPEEYNTIQFVINGQTKINTSHLNKWLVHKIRCDGKATERILNAITIHNNPT